MADKSEFEVTRERRAARLGIGTDDLRAHDRALLRSSSYPTKDCLNPSDLQNQALVETIGHVLECPMCAAQIEVVYRALRLAKLGGQTKD